MADIAAIARAVLALAALALALAAPAQASGRDSLFVGDGIDNNVEVFDASTGAHRRSMPTAAAAVVGPRGLILREGGLFLVNQNVNTPFTGELLRFSAGSGALLQSVVPKDTPKAPFAPRGMVLWHKHLFVANVCDPCEPPDRTGGGGILKYDAATGAHKATLRPPPGGPEFHPFGVVIGPDGLLYVSSRPNLFSTGLGGQVLRFDPDSGAHLGTFVSSRGGDNRLNGPEGLVFGPDGNLYVTSFRGSAADTDKILVFEGPAGAHPGRRAGRIDLDRIGAARSTAQTLLFGPGGDLFVPISNLVADAATDTGAVRRYRIGCRQTAARPCFTNLVEPCDELGAACRLGQGWYLSIGRTRPGTLAYGG